MAEAKTFTQNNDYDEIVNLVGEIYIGNVELPHDLVIEILLKLPVKSLIRFKTVCKPWKLLIDSHVFINNHLHRKNPLHNFFPVDLLKKNPFPFYINYSVGSCNGIICFETTNPQNPLVLFNPSTREFSLLPKECKGDFYGFCYLSQTQEYKVICFKRRNCNIIRDRSCTVDMMILTLGTKTASYRDVKDVTVPGLIPQHRCYPNQATSRGTIVWLGYNHQYTTIAICYDVLEDRFSKMNLPPSYVDGCKTYSLRVSRSRVIMFLYPYGYARSFDIWILVTRDESKVKSWIKYRHVKIDPRQKRSSTIKPMNVCRDDRWILCSTDDSDYGEHWNYMLFYYDLETNQVEDYKPANLDRVTQFVNYVESLVSPKDICSCLEDYKPANLSLDRVMRFENYVESLVSPKDICSSLM